MTMAQHALPSIGLGLGGPGPIPNGNDGLPGGAAGEDEPISVQEDILRHSPFCGCSQVVAAFGAALEVATASSKWQAMAAESNFGTSKMVLQRVKRVWPVAAVFEGE